ncbi:MAG: hypothetical protein AABZ60_21490 [Planctomycetota bacterium]
MRKIYKLLLLFFALGCASEPVQEYATYENLLSIISDLQRHLDDDIYQFSMPLDPSGQNVFKATLIRLENYQQLSPDKFQEIVAYSRAKCHQKLGNFEEALFYFQQTLSYENGKLKNLAQKEAQWTQALIQIFKIPVPRNDINAILDQFDRRDTLFKKLMTEYEDIDTSLVWRELERNTLSKIEFLRQNRLLLTQGTNRVIQGYQNLIRDHKNSEQIYRYLLSLADFYVLLAKEYLVYHPADTLAFQKEAFCQLTQPAIEIYRLIANVDGRLEKIEAQGSLVSLMALLEKYQILSDG